MAMYTVGKTFGCLDIACENDSPARCRYASSVITSASGFRLGLIGEDRRALE